MFWELLLSLQQLQRLQAPRQDPAVEQLIKEFVSIMQGEGGAG